MNAVIVFLKYPEPGKVKTRLAKDVGPERATQVYEALLAYTLKEIAALDRNRFTLLAYCDPFRPVTDYQSYLNDFRGAFVLQTGTDLGERLSSAASLQLGKHERILIIGTDCPHLSARHFEEADRLLNGKDCDVVLGPTHDGGYYLIGMKSFHAELFQAMPWSTEVVCRLTIEKAEKLGLSVRLLEKLSDVDTAEDLVGTNF